MGRSLASVSRELTAPYSPMEAWGYDRLVGNAAAKATVPVLLPLLRRLPRNARLLDVGCGGGHLLARLAEAHPGLSLQGIDLNEKQVAWARKRLTPFEDRVLVVRGSALNLPFDDAAFDAAVSIASIKHWQDQGRGIREMIRVFRPGGELHVGEVDRGCRLVDARRFVAGLPLPSPLRGLLFPYFRTYILGQGWEVDEARKLLEGLPLRDARIDRPAGLPVLSIEGMKLGCECQGDDPIGT